MCKPKTVASVAVASNSVSGSCDVAGSQRKKIAMRKEKELMEASNNSTRNNRIIASNAAIKYIPVEYA